MLKQSRFARYHNGDCYNTIMLSGCPIKRFNKKHQSIVEYVVDVMFIVLNMNALYDCSTGDKQLLNHSTLSDASRTKRRCPPICK